MTMNGEIIPRNDLTPTDFRRLGQAITSWAESPGVEWYHIDAVEDLLRGELPSAMTLKLFRRYNGLDAAGTPGFQGKEHVVSFEARDNIADRLIVQKRLRESIPTELVQDITVDGCSWTEWPG